MEKIVFNIIKSISHEELVNLIRTALYGSTYLSASYDKEFYASLPNNKKVGETFEDKLVDCLLNGGEIYLDDNDSKGEVYGKNRAEVIDKDGLKVTRYTLTLIDVIRGLERALNGEYEGYEMENQWVSHCFSRFENNCDDFNNEEADSLIQVILFHGIEY